MFDSEDDEGTWEYNAYRTIVRHELDVPTKVGSDFEGYYNNGLYSTLAACAWAQVRKDNAQWNAEDQVALLASKQHDYGNDNILKFGQQGILVRLWDKIARYNNLLQREVRGHDVANESVTDTLIDIVGYVVLLYMVQDGTFTSPLKADK